MDGLLFYTNTRYTSTPYTLHGCCMRSSGNLGLTVEFRANLERQMGVGGEALLLSDILEAMLYQ